MILVSALFVLARFLLLGVVAQTGTNVTGCAAELYWTVDAEGHVPCWTAAQLYIPCGIGNKFLQTIPPDTWYLGPNSTYQDECGCSSAVYMLTSACGACQRRQWVNYTYWSRECPERLKYIGYPKEVPIGVILPEWALMNVSELAGQSFDPAKAQIVAAAQSASAQPPSSSSTSLPTPAAPTTTQALPNANASSESGKSNTGAIAGGVVGSLVFLACLGLLIFWLILRKRSRTARELRSKALDLTEADHHHDSEKTEVRIFGGGSRFGGYSGRQDSPPPVSVVGGRSWYSRESREHHGRHPSSSSGGHGQVQSYVNALNNPEHHAPAMGEGVMMGQPGFPPPSYPTHIRRPSVDSLNAPPPLSAGLLGQPTGGMPGFAGNVSDRKQTILLPPGYTGAAEAT